MKNKKNLPRPANAVAFSHFDVNSEPPGTGLLAWRQQVAHVIDVLPSKSQLEKPFKASLDRYQIGDRMFTERVSDALLLDRSVARISTDSARGYAFQVFAKGGVENVAGMGVQRVHKTLSASILAMDLDQPLRMQIGANRTFLLFVPRPVVEAILPHAESIHGRVLDNTSPLTQLLIDYITALPKRLRHMPMREAASAFNHAVALILSAFGKHARLSGNARAAVNAAMFDQVRRFVHTNLHQSSLTPEHLLAMLQLRHRTLYRLFEHEGGIGAYIRNRRLREAAYELVRFPKLNVVEIALGLGFKSPSDFARAFRRAYEMTPQDLRAMARHGHGHGQGEIGNLDLTMPR